MATLALTDQEVNEVRTLLGSRLTTDDLSDEQIRSDSLLGASSDYVFEKVREDIDVSKFSASELQTFNRFRDETEDDIANFVNMVLKPPQRLMFRRSVILRTAGACAPVVDKIVNESAVGIYHSIGSAPSWDDLQGYFFFEADEQIKLLREAFPDDAFLSYSEGQRRFSINTFRIT